MYQGKTLSMEKSASGEHRSLEGLPSKEGSLKEGAWWPILEKDPSWKIKRKFVEQMAFGEPRGMQEASCFTPDVSSAQV